MPETVNEVLLTTVGKGDRKGCVKRRQRRGTVKEGKEKAISHSRGRV
jgi:hypothetical protein